MSPCCGMARKIGTRPTSEVTKQDLANWMVGREVGFTPDRGQVEPGEVRLRLDGCRLRQ